MQRASAAAADLDPLRLHVVDHIDYVVRRIGVDHVGIGSDFDGYDGVTLGLADVSCLPSLTARLAARG